MNSYKIVAKNMAGDMTVSRVCADTILEALKELVNNKEFEEFCFDDVNKIDWMNFKITKEYIKEGKVTAFETYMDANDTQIHIRKNKYPRFSAKLNLMAENLVSDVVWYDEADALKMTTVLRQAGDYLRKKELNGIVYFPKEKEKGDN
ncbi:MAG: hypothetical protein IJ213_09045 [Bacteroidales bacterium]|nr:hypothetical protein [Bacteroidales bacterium]